MPYLTVRFKGKRVYRTHLIEGDECTAGRSSKCELHLEHESVSRQHCRFFKDGDDWMVEDLGSKFGLRIDASSKLEGPQPVGEGQIIKIGSARLTWHVADEVPDKVKAREGKEVISRERKEREAKEGGGRTVLAREVGENDPPEAMPCPKCDAWLSITHRMPSERLRCPVCDAKVAVVELVETAGEA
jgi:pSer/pThr/pTyr-binding forkhead associated (FHA) protein